MTARRSAAPIWRYFKRRLPSGQRASSRMRPSLHRSGHTSITNFELSSQPKPKQRLLALSPGREVENFSRHEGLDLQAADGTEVLDVGGDEGEDMLDGGGADQGIGQAHAVRQRQRIDQLGRALGDRRRDL